MSHTVTETDTFPSTITVPDDGDDLDEASVEGDGIGFEGLADRTRYLYNRIRLGGNIDWSGRLSCAPGSTNLIVGPIHSMLIGNKLFTTSVDTTIPTSSLGPSTWYVLYAYNNSGVLAFERPAYGSAPPDASLQFEDGDPTRRYIGCFRTDGSGNILPFRAVRGHYLWRRSGVSSSVFAALGAGGATSLTDVSLANLVPAHARIADLELRFTNTSTPAGVSLVTKGDSASGFEPTLTNTTNNDTKTAHLEIETNASQVVQYGILGGTGAVSIYVNGWRE